MEECCCHKTKERTEEEYKRLIADKQYLLDTANAGAEKAARLANRTLTKAKKKVGLLLG